MKKTVNFLLILLLMFGLSACLNEPVNENPKPDEITYEQLDLTKLSWVDDNEISVDTNNQNRGNKAYTLSTNENKLSVIQPHKFDKQNSISLDLSAYDLTKYKKIKVTAEGDGVMKLIINSTVTVMNYKNQIVYPLSMIEDKFEFKLDYEGYDVLVKNITSITLIFGADVNENIQPEHKFTSEIKISELSFTDAPSNPKLTYNEKAVIFDPNENGELPDLTNIVQNWTNNDAGSYIINQVSNGYQIITTSDKQAWSFINLVIDGNYSGYAIIEIVVKGDAGAKFKMKLEGEGIRAYETGNTTNNNIVDPVLSGESQTITWQIPQEIFMAGKPIKFLIFFEPAETGTGKQMVISTISLKK